jgi:hypothetical protein
VDLGRFEEALATIDEAMARGWDHPGLHWERMAAAAALSRWDDVRGSADALELTFDGADGAWSHAGSYCLVEHRAPNDRVLVKRVTPVTGEVLSVTHPRAGRQRRGDRVVYRAEPLEPPREQSLFVYRLVHVLEEGRFETFPLDGAHPGEARLDALAEAIAGLGGTLSVRSAEAYEVTDPGGGTLPGVYMLVALPGAVPPAELARAVDRVMAGAAHPLLSRVLARAVGDAARLEAVEAGLAAYGLDGE